MIKLEYTEVCGWEAAIRGMRNPLNSWDKSDSYWTHIEDAETHQTAKFEFFVGANDLDLMKRLRDSGSDHRKFMRMLIVYVDITAPLYWWKQMDQYKIGTVTNSCSTMHKIHAKEFVPEDFSIEHCDTPVKELYAHHIIPNLNLYRDLFNAEKMKNDWENMIQLLPTSYNQKRTVMLNYEVLANIYHSRKNHKLNEWVELCEWASSLPYAKELICGVGEDT